MKLKSWRSEKECGVSPLLQLFSGLLWSEVMVPVMVSSMGKIDLFKNDSYLSSGTYISCYITANYMHLCNIMAKGFRFIYLAFGLS